MATRWRAGSRSTWTPGRPRGGGPLTTSMPSGARCSTRGFRRGSRNGCGWACDPMIGGRRSLQGRKPGDRRVRVERPHAALFRWTGPGQLTAKEAASGPTTPTERLVARVKAVLLGRPLASEEEIGERLTKKKALAIFSSD